ncbi:MAG TPA: cyclic nucleotide-binding domain-containing protein [bacterium]|nr:cyclic nucleotide-binding domain-containing protein [bacterium]
MSKDLLPIFNKDPKKLSLAEEALLFSVDEPSNGKMYILLEGQAEIVIGKYMVELAQPGAIIGEMGMIDQEPRSATVRCVTPCVFAEVDEKRFLNLIQQTPVFAMELLKGMAARLRRIDRTI